MTVRGIFAALLVVVAGLVAHSFALPDDEAGVHELGKEVTVDPIERVGAWPFGPSYAAAVDPVRDLVFLGAGGVVLVLDGSDPEHPTLISDTLRTVGLVLDVEYDQATQRLFVAGGEGGLEIWDVADPAVPSRLSITEVLYFGYDTPVGNVELHEHFAIVECEWGYVHSLDVSDPTAPVDVSFNGSMGNPARNIHVSPDGQVHSTGAQRYQRILIQADGTFNTSGAYDFDWGPATVFGTSEVAYVSWSGYMFILDLLHPAFLPWTFIDVGGFADIEVQDGLAYLINGSGLNIYDVHVHNSPFPVSVLPSDMSFHDLEVVDGLAYIAAGFDGLRIVDVSDPYEPEEIGTYKDVVTVTWMSVVVGDLAYLAHSREGVLVIDFGDLESPELVGRLDTPSYTRDLALEGNLLLVADLDGGLRVADLANPTQPVEVGALEEFSVWRVEAGGDTAYVLEAIANEPYRLHTVDMTDPTQPQTIGSLELPGRAWDLVRAGEYVYVAGDDFGVRVVDVSNPAAPVEVGSYPLPSVTELVVQEGLLYVAAFESFGGGLFILDLADPVHPTPVGDYVQTGFAPFHLDVQGDYAVTDDFDDLHLFFVGDPTNPADLDEYTMPDGVGGITLREELVFVSNVAAGLQIVENTLHDDPGGGLQWEELPSGTGNDLLAVCFTDADNGWVVGDGGTILHTSDGGDSWQPQGSGTSSALLAVDCDGARAWAAGTQGTILGTTDGGGSWLPQAAGTSADLSSVDFVDMIEGWAVGDDGTILHSTDGGESWSAQPSGTGLYLSSVSFVDSSHGWVTTGDFGGVLRTTDGGTSWHGLSTGSGAILFDVQFVDTSFGWAVGMFGEVIATTDGGATWTQQPIPHPPDWLYGVCFTDPDNGWAVGFDGKIITTEQGGDTWTSLSSGVHVQLNGVHFVDPAHGWAVGHGGTILRAAGSATSAIFADGFESGDTSNWSVSDS